MNALPNYSLLMVLQAYHLIRVCVCVGPLKLVQLMPYLI